MTNIGVFDSGVGGLTVLSKLVNNRKANYFYFGDCLRAPYGPRSSEDIVTYTEQIVEFLEQFEIDKYVIACNTISVLATNYLINKYNKVFIPITEAGLEKALEYDGDFLVLATETTVNSHFYRDSIEKYSDSKVYEIPATDLVSLIEDGDLEGGKMDNALKRYLQVANDKKIANVILGCTHFPIAETAINNNLSYRANIINPADKILDNIDIVEDSKKRIKIFMSEVNDITKSIIDSMIDFDYELEVKEL